MGWINCDYFWKVNQKLLVDLQTDQPQVDKIPAKLIFKRRKVILNADPNGAFNRIPKGEEAVVIAFTVRNGKPMVAMQDLTTSDEIVSLQFKPLTPEALREKLPPPAAVTTRATPAV